jgi:hypothetical protein
MSEELDNSIKQNAEGPAKASGDAGSALPGDRSPRRANCSRSFFLRICQLSRRDFGGPAKNQWWKEPPT